VKEKIILGTVQLGLPYGINNKTGKPSIEEAFKILDFAHANGIRTLDSADGYGEALQVIGRHKAATGKVFDIINKFKADNTSLTSKIQKCLDLLQCSSLSCYMYHEFSDYQSGVVSKELQALKAKGLTERIGVSLYTTEQLSAVINDEAIDVIQLPANILDFSRRKRDLLQQARENGKEIHARSIYLQGLLLKTPDSLTGNLVPLSPYLEKLISISTTRQTDIKRLAFNFVFHQALIDHIVLGIEHISQLHENLNLIDPTFDPAGIEEIEVSTTDSFLLNPALWKI
jgi:aryl-alcohol dehydrogenase-like predicted oxidoreductase